MIHNLSMRTVGVLISNSAYAIPCRLASCFAYYLLLHGYPHHFVSKMFYPSIVSFAYCVNWGSSIGNKCVLVILPTENEKQYEVFTASHQNLPVSLFSIISSGDWLWPSQWIIFWEFKWRSALYIPVKLVDFWNARSRALYIWYLDSTRPWDLNSGLSLKGAYLVAEQCPFYFLDEVVNILEWGDMILY